MHLTRRKFLGITVPMLAVGFPVAGQAFPAPKTGLAWERLIAMHGEWWVLRMPMLPGFHQVEIHRDDSSPRGQWDMKGFGLYHTLMHCRTDLEARNAAERWVVSYFEDIQKQVKNASE